MRPAKPFTAEVAAAAARSYLQTRFTTRAHLRVVLLRRAARSEAGPDASAIVDTLLDRLVASGALDDAAWAEARVQTLVRRGVAPPVIAARVAAKGADGRAGLAALRDEGVDPGFAAACAFVRRRRIGPWRADPAERAEERERDLAKLARAGFSFDLARRVLALAGPDALAEALRD